MLREYTPIDLLDLSMPRTPNIDLGALIALIWLLVAAGATVLLAPYLGARGWLWLAVHHLLCGVGVTHELSRALKRRRARTTSEG